MVRYNKWGWAVYKRVLFFFWVDIGPAYLSKESAVEAVKRFMDVEYF